MSTLFQDFSYCIRSLRKTPGFTFVSVATLAFAIAANIVVFSILDAIALQPPPYRNAGRISVLRWSDRKLQPQAEVSAAVFFMLQKHAQSFATVAASYPQDVGINLAGSGVPRYVKALRVSQSYFETLGVEPILGRSFLPEEDRAGSPGTVILSYRLWETGFNREPAILGEQLRINGAQFSVIGVMPSGFYSYPNADVWVPLQLNDANADPGSDYLVLASLKDTVVPSQAEQELSTLSRNYPMSYLPGMTAGTAQLSLEDLQKFRTARVRRQLTLLFFAVATVLLVTCTNVTVLLLVRGLARTQEMALRAALGSSKWRLVQIVLTESALVAACGGILGIALGKELLQLAVSILPHPLLEGARIDMNRQSLLFGLALSALTLVVLGFLPAIKLDLKSITASLRPANRGITAGVGQTRLAQLLVTTEAALTVVLLGFGLLLLQSFINLCSVSPGFNPTSVSVIQVSLAGARYQTTAATCRLVDSVVDQLARTAGVETVGTSNGLPLETGLNLPVYPMDSPRNIDHAVQYRMVKGSYFKALRIQLLSGRLFSQQDGAKGQPVAIINEVLARRWWPNESAIGHYLHAGEEYGPEFNDHPRQVIGVVANVHELGLRYDSPPTVFVPDDQVSDSLTAFTNKLFLLSILVRTKQDLEMSEQIKSVLASADPDLPIASSRPMTVVMNGSLARPRFYTQIAGLFAVFALLLTAIGLYGLLSYQVQLRMPELGVRIALGATRPQIVWLIIRQGIRLSATALFLGLIGSIFVSRALSGMLYNTDHVFLRLLIGEGALLGFVTIMVTSLAAARISAIEPLTVLRSQ